MKCIVLICVGLLLAGCAAASEGSAGGMIYDTMHPGEREAARKAKDDAKCRDFGFEPKTEGYAYCRLKLEELRAKKQSTGQVRSRAGTVAGAGGQRNSFMCKDAISRGDSGGVFIFC